ncbi:hypothetical protein IAD21_03256 [Abditibacteriota bacterium]|nr:hypothetical protein IAD21_03256 [Abditibacteriota bacterium]
MSIPDSVRQEMQSRGLARLLPYIPRLLHPFIRVMVTGSDLDTWLGTELNADSLEEIYFHQADPTPVGISKIGGWPDIWPGFEWPQVKEMSLPLLAQFRMEDIAPYDEERSLPTQGMLLIFYDFMADLEGEQAVQVLYFEGDFSTLQRAGI